MSSRYYRFIFDSELCITYLIILLSEFDVIPDYKKIWNQFFEATLQKVIGSPAIKLLLQNCLIFKQNHFRYVLNHLKPSAQPFFLATLHINTSIGRAPLFHSFLGSMPKTSLSSFSGTAPALSILLPNITIGTFYNSGISSIPCNSIRLSSKRLALDESTRYMIPSTSETQFLHVLRAASWPPKSQALKVILPIVSSSEQGCCVGSICFMTSSLSLNKRVVFPASSRPRNTILAFLLTSPKDYRVDLNQLTIHIERILNEYMTRKQQTPISIVILIENHLKTTTIISLNIRITREHHQTLTSTQSNSFPLNILSPSITQQSL